MMIFSLILLSILTQCQGFQRDFNPGKLLSDYETCLAMFRDWPHRFPLLGQQRYYSLSSCIEILEVKHGQIVSLETIEKVLKSPLNPVDNMELFDNCVIESSNKSGNVSVTDYMDRFVESVQFLDDRAVSQKNQEKLACLELNNALKFLCVASEKCATTMKEQKQLQFMYVVGYSLFQTVMGTNQQLDCHNDDNESWNGQLAEAVWSSSAFNVESQIFKEEDNVCSNDKNQKVIFVDRFEVKKEKTVGLNVVNYQKLFNPLAKF